jgi:hypothetical protein
MFIAPIDFDVKKSHDNLEIAHIRTCYNWIL